MRTILRFVVLLTAALAMEAWMAKPGFGQAGGAGGGAAGGAGVAGGGGANGMAGGGIGGIGGLGGAAGGAAIGGGATGGIAGLGGAAGGTASGGVGATGGSGIGNTGLGGSGVHQGNILTGPGASGIPQNYFRGAMPGMGLSPQESPSGSLGSPGRSALGGGRNGIGGAGSSRALRGLGNGRVGRGVGPVPKGGDENPAEILLDEMNGSHNGQRTGHAALRPPRQYQRGVRGMSSDPPSLAPQRIEERAVYFAKRGAYEDMVYRPYQGSYRTSSRRTVAANRNRRAY
ncbi:MAG TPA: hypothetical protein VFI31_10110 [Pirellulales bacterium]|nr:hypothetical protein [Pirellulales bacterium]